MSTDAPTLAYWHVWTDEHGVSHQQRRTLHDFGRQSMGGAAPQWNDVLEQKPARAMFSVLPAGWIGDWHENPAPQWIVPLSGHWKRWMARGWKWARARSRLAATRIAWPTRMGTRVIVPERLATRPRF